MSTSFPATRVGANRIRFEFATATRILFGRGAVSQLGPLAARMGGRALVVTGRTPARAQPVLDALAEEGIASVAFSVGGEPTTDIARAGIERAREERCELVIGFGGGSAMDTAKAIAALLTNSGQILDYLEVIGQGKPLTRPSAPTITIPTTAGTGAEVTRNAVLASVEHRVKDLCQALRVPPLGAYGLTPADVPDLVERAAVASSMRANPIQLTRQEMEEILVESL